MQNKTCWIVFGFLAWMFFTMSSYGQVIIDKTEYDKREPLEEMDDPYLPNEFNNQKTSKAYHSKIFPQSKSFNSSIVTTQVNIDANGNNIIGDAANEPNIAINPLDPNQIIIGWRQFDNVASNFRQAGKSFTTDGGITWTFNGVLEPGIFRSDPVLDYDSIGNFYFNSLTIDSLGNYPCKVFESTNGGANWDNGTDAGGGDKAWMTIDRTNGIGSGNIYSAWVSDYSSCSPGFFNRSVDGGDIYDNCTIVNGNPHWGTMTVGNAGELYISGTFLPDGIIVAKSVNAQIPGSLISWNSPVLVYMDGWVPSGTSINPAGLLGQANIDIDRSNGPGRDNVYILAPMLRPSISDPGDIRFSRSTDGGLTWSSPMSINDDNSINNTQWFGTMSVAPNGRIDAVWLDTRDQSFGVDSSALYYSYSLDEGNSWSVNQKMSSYFDPHIGYPNQNKMGDYFDMISDNEGAHVAWANTFNGEEDVYYSRILVPAEIGITGNPAIGFFIFPNPTSGIINIVTNDNQPAIQLEITSVTGQTIFASKEINIGTSGSYQFDISNFANGSYIVRVNNQHKIIIKN